MQKYAWEIRPRLRDGYDAWTRVACDKNPHKCPTGTFSHCPTEGGTAGAGAIMSCDDKQISLMQQNETRAGNIR